jgi:hypothetical protein
MKKRAVFTAFLAIILFSLFFIIGRFAAVRPLANSIKVTTLSLNKNKIFAVLYENDKIYGDNYFSVFELSKNYTVKKILWNGKGILTNSEIPFVYTEGYLLKIVTFDNSSLNCKQKLIKIDTSSNAVSEFTLPENHSIEPYMNGPQFKRQVFASDGFLFANAGRKILIFNCKTNAFKSFPIPGYMKSFYISKAKYDKDSDDKTFYIYGIIQLGDFNAFMSGIFTIHNGETVFDNRVYWFNDQSYTLNAWKIFCNDRDSDEMLIMDDFMGRQPLLRSFNIRSAYGNNGILVIQSPFVCSGHLKSGIVYSTDTAVSNSIVLASGYLAKEKSPSTELIIFDLTKRKNFIFKRNACKIINLNEEVFTLTTLNYSNRETSFIAIGKNHIYKICVSNIHSKQKNAP